MRCVGYCGLQYVAYAEGVVRAYNIQSFAVLYTLQSECLFLPLHAGQGVIFCCCCFTLKDRILSGFTVIGFLEYFPYSAQACNIYMCAHIYRVRERERERESELSGVSCCI